MSSSNHRVCAIILAAGKGTRMNSEVPKVLHQVAGKPILSRVIETLADAGVEHHCLVLGGEIENFETILKQNPELTCVIQKKRLGTGDAVASAMIAFDGYQCPPYTDSELYKGPKVEASHVLISAGDTPALSVAIIKSFVEESLKQKCKLSVIGMRHNQPHGYGRIILNEGRLSKIVEEKDADEAIKKINLCNTGVIFAETRFLFERLHELDNNNAQKEYYLTDCFEKAKDLGEPAFVYETDDYKSFDGVNNRAQLCQIEEVIISKTRSRLQEEGVTFKLPQTCYIEDSVKIGRDSIIGPHCTLVGSTKIGERCFIGAGSFLENQTVDDDQSIGPGTILHPVER